jgi:hypothetical protein
LMKFVWVSPQARERQSGEPQKMHLWVEEEEDPERSCKLLPLALELLGRAVEPRKDELPDAPEVRD